MDIASRETLSTTGSLTSNPSTHGRVKVFGVGTAGINLLDQVIAAGLPAAGFVAVHCDPAGLAGSAAPEKIQVEPQLLRRLAAINDPDAARLLGEQQMPNFKSLCDGAQTALIIAGLGGGVGTMVAPLLCAAARQNGALALAHAVLPFECEGTLRSQVARAGIERLKDSADLVMAFRNQKTITLIPEGTPLLEIFKTSNQFIGREICSAFRALTSPTVIGMSFAELCVLLRERSHECAFAAVEASGPNATHQVMENLLSHPALNAGCALPEAATLGVFILGGRALGMVEVNRIMERIHKESSGAPVVMGAAVCPEFGDRLTVGLLVGAAEQEQEEPALASTPRRGMGTGLVSEAPAERMESAPRTRFVPPPPSLSPERIEHLRKQQGGSKSRKTMPRLRQSQLPLEIISKGRFEKSEPTIHKGEDLDVPTYIRRGIALN
jgi:cell division protein FtsZ